MSHEGDRNLSRLYRAGAREEPPAWLDAKVLAEAKLTAPAQSRRRAFAAARWGAPLALAAVLVLSVSLVMLVGTDDPGTGAHVTPAPRPATPLSAEAPPPAPGELSSITPPAQPQEVPRRAQAEADSRPQAAEPQAKRRERLLAPRQDEHIILHTEKRAAPQAEVSPAPAAHAPADPPPVAAAASSARDKAEAPMAAAQPEAKARSTPPPAPQAGASALPERGATTAERGESGDPEKWLREIERLRREGHDQAARESLEAFRKRYPDHPIPASLK